MITTTSRPLPATLQPITHLCCRKVRNKPMWATDADGLEEALYYLAVNKKGKTQIKINMKSTQTMFFALTDDLSEIYKTIESEFDIHYYRTGLTESDSIINYKSIFEFPFLGSTNSGDWNKIEQFLVLQKDTPLKVEKVPQRKGGVMYYVDQTLNMKSITLKPGGVYRNEDKILVAGRIATMSDEIISKKLFNFFSKKVKKHFKRVGNFYVGEKALEKLNEGWRLVTNDNSPREYDLGLV